MINLDQHPFCIQRDFVLTYGSDAGIFIEEKYCKIIDRKVNGLNKRRLWINTQLQEADAVRIIKDYERANGKTN